VHVVHACAWPRARMLATKCRVSCAAGTAERVATRFHGREHWQVAQQQTHTAALLLEAGETAEAEHLLQGARAVLLASHPRQSHVQDGGEQHAHHAPGHGDAHGEEASMMETALRRTLEHLVVCQRESNRSDEVKRQWCHRRAHAGGE